jgi:hypothetical protein
VPGCPIGSSPFPFAGSVSDQSPEPLPLYPCHTDPNPFAQTLRYFSPLSACSLVLNGFDNGVNSRPTYSKIKHCSIILDM